MSAAAAAAARPFTSLSARLRAGGPSLEDAGRRRGELAVRATAFAALAAFASVHWTALVADPPLGRTLLVVLIATVAGPAIALVPTPARDAWRAGLARAAIVVLALEAALAVLGLPGHMLAPAAWGELSELIGRGLTGLRTAQWPYSGPDEVVRLTILLAIPPAVVLASALAFWPRRRGRSGPRAVAVVILLALYGVAIAQVDPGEPVAQGAVLLALAAALLLLPRVRPADAARAAAALLVVAALAVPFAVRLPGAEPVIDYTSWRWVGDTTAFEWDHSYGPLDWSRRGEVVMTVESERPHYWRAVTLDTFDGFRWTRSLAGASTLTDPEPPPSERAGWYVSATVTVGSLVSNALVSPGLTQSVDGVEGAVVTRDGSVETGTELDQGAQYTIDAYAPNPTVREMREAPDIVPASLSTSMLIQLPALGASNPEAPGADGEDPSEGPAISLPPRGEGTASSEGGALMLASPYARTYELARRLAAPAKAPTTYDAVRRIEEFLRSGYSYSEQPPARQYPVDSFLFEDRKGYCQQFAGAMALMLRMNGIPSRVVGGFAPGIRTGGTRDFTVRDVDAHSWVEVHFTGIGWVPFDPTPPDAPADSQSDGSLASAARGSAGRQVGLGGLFAASEPGAAGLAASALERAGAAGPGAANPSIVREATVAVVAPDREPGNGRFIALAIAGALLALCGLVLGRAWAGAGRGPAADVGELDEALHRLGHRHRPGATLLDLERRLERSRQRDAARYVRRVRERRYGRTVARPPDARGRRALRRSLTRGGGARGFLRGYVLLPPRRV